MEFLPPASPFLSSATCDRSKEASSSNAAKVSIISAKDSGAAVDGPYKVQWLGATEPGGREGLHGCTSKMIPSSIGRRWATSRVKLTQQGGRSLGQSPRKHHHWAFTSSLRPSRKQVLETKRELFKLILISPSLHDFLGATVGDRTNSSMGGGAIGTCRGLTQEGSDFVLASRALESGELKLPFLWYPCSTALVEPFGCVMF